MSKNTSSKQRVRVNELGIHDSLKIESEWLTTKEAAEYIRTSPQTVLNRTSNGELPYYKDGRRNLYRKSELREMLLTNKRGGFHGN